LKLVVGLGNPGRAYARTRHNVGFMVVEELARRAGARWHRGLRFPVRTAEIEVGGQTVGLAEPLTFMNRSGDAVGPLVRRRGVTSEDVLVIYDDADVPVGALRIRPFGGAGGHNGMRSVTAALGTERFARMRIGIGRGEPALMEHVLAPFTAEEWKQLEETIRMAADAALCWAAEGVEPAMNRFNRAAKAGVHGEHI
jgi:PTH1 family peptidyl-tRNA hydrolase